MQWTTYAGGSVVLLHDRCRCDNQQGPLPFAKAKTAFYARVHSPHYFKDR
jgi:hypothetical protein